MKTPHICPECKERGFIQNDLFYHSFIVDSFCVMEGKPMMDKSGESISGSISLLNLPPLRDYQEVAVRHNLQSTDSDLIVIPTGEGKTIVGLSIINNYKLPSLIVCPTIILTKQWVNFIREYGGKATSISSEGDNIFSSLSVTTYASALRNLDILSQYNIIIFDESHHVCSREYQKIADRALDLGLIIVGLTATERTDEEGRPVQEKIFKRKYIRTLAQRQQSDQRIPLTFIERKVILSPEQKKKYEENWEIYTEEIKKYGGFQGMMSRGGRTSKGYFYSMNDGAKAYNMVKKLLSENPSKIDLVVDIIRNNEGNFIVFGDTIKMVEIIHSRLREAGISSIKIHSVRKKHKDDQKEQSRTERERLIKYLSEGKVRVLVGAVAIEEGLDLPDMDNAIFVSIFSPSAKKSIQRSGRVMRPRPDKHATIYVLYSENTIEEKKRLPELRKLLGVE